MWNKKEERRINERKLKGKNKCHKKGSVRSKYWSIPEVEKPHLFFGREANFQNKYRPVLK
jgi:hypothetical protein